MAFDTRANGPATSSYEALMGQTYVGIGETGELRVLDADRASTLSAWVSQLIPANDAWPSAGDLDTVAYIDAVLWRAPQLRPILLAGIDAADSTSCRSGTPRFVDASTADQVAVLQELERTVAPEAFATVLELTYEAYYRAPSVQAIVKERTAFDITRTVQGVPLEPFPTERLTRVSLLPARLRDAS